MKIMGLDLSSKSGYAILNDNSSIITYGTLLDAYGTDKVPSDLNKVTQEYKLIWKAKQVARLIKEIVDKYQPDSIYIERLPSGGFRATKEVLYFIHFAVLNILEPKLVRYVEVSQWRSTLNIRLSKDQRNHNKDIKIKRKLSGKKTSKRGEGKITWKHLSVNKANEIFNLNLQLKDNDAADALLIALYGVTNGKESININPNIDLNEALSIK